MKLKNAKKSKSEKADSVDWNIFDSIWCISFTGYPERRKAVEVELKRIGILDSGRFNWRFTFPTIFDNILFDVTKKKLNHNNCKNVPSMSCSLGHYGCIKTAYELGHEFTMIMEDDIRFLKDTGKIKEIMEDIPPCADIVNLDCLPTEEKYSGSSFSDLIKEKSYNNNFFNYNGEILWGGSCYALSRKAMERICIRYEQLLSVADDYTSGRINLGKDVSYYASKESICCQIMYRKSVNSMLFGDSSLHYVYKKKNIDYSKYNIFDVENYDYGKSICK